MQHTTGRVLPLGRQGVTLWTAYLKGTTFTRSKQLETFTRRAHGVGLPLWTVVPRLSGGRVRRRHMLGTLR